MGSREWEAQRCPSREFERRVWAAGAHVIYRYHEPKGSTIVGYLVFSKPWSSIKIKLVGGCFKAPRIRTTVLALIMPMCVCLLRNWLGDVAIHL